jgi:hypothetical protein
MEVAADGLEHRLRRLLPGGRPSVLNESWASEGPHEQEIPDQARRTKVFWLSWLVLYPIAGDEENAIWRFFYAISGALPPSRGGFECSGPGTEGRGSLGSS